MPQLEQKLQAKLSQKLIITPQLQQAIKLLQLSKLELQDEIGQELENNPALEEAGTTLSRASDSESGNRETEVTAGEDAVRSDDNIDYAAYFDHLDGGREASMMRGEREAPSEDLPTIEQVLSNDDRLADHLTWQLEMSVLPPADRAIGEAIIGNLDERGYLESSVEELAAMAPPAGPAAKPWDVADVERVLKVVQQFDPVGVATRNLQECLLVQLECTGRADSPAATAIRDHLPLLEARKHNELALALGLDATALDEMLDEIRHLDPRPGEKYNPQQTRYIVPDVYVVKDSDEYRIVLNEEGLPKLRVSPNYRKFFDGGSGPTGAGDPSAREFVREKVRAAIRLIRSLEERQRTIYKVAASIVKFQRPFLDEGIEAIRPLILRDVAEDIGMHESTVSRVVNNKYMHTHRGLFEMRFFFHSGLSVASGGEAVSSLTVKEKIKRMVAEEDRRNPLSDQAIAEVLRRDGLNIARRTVAKYREELRIASSTQRKSQR